MSQLQLKRELAELAMMSPTQLRAAWHPHHGSAAPSLSADLLRLGLAYRLQEVVLGGLDPVSRRTLGGKRPEPSLPVGTRLLRSWNGQSVSVTVTEAGFLYDGCEWSSLTSIAKAVTGTQYSGPRFFAIGAYAKR